jgi:hypothetical protein
MRNICFVVFLICMMLPVGCGEDDATLPGLDLKVIGVRGSVTNAQGAPQTASVSLRAFRGDCASGAADGEGSASSSNSGQYSGLLTSSNQEGLRCVVARATAGQLSGEAQLGSVVFPTRIARDTITLNIVVR